MKFVDMQQKAIAITQGLLERPTHADTDRVRAVLVQLRRDALDEAILACDDVDTIDVDGLEIIRRFAKAIDKIRELK